MKHIFIINPKSGKQKSYELISVIQDYFKEKNDTYEIIITEAPGHATELAAQFADADCIYSIGGDGTAYEVLNGMPENVAMAVIPAGTGNDYFSMYNYPKKNLEDILIKTIEGRNVKVDYGVANGHRFLNCFCMGLDAEVVYHANNYSKRYPLPNKLSYMASVLRSIPKPKKLVAKAKVGEENINMDAVLIAVMNGQYYGGGFQPTPEASIQDGILDVLFVEYLKTMQIVPLLPKYFAGKHQDVKEVHAYKGNEVHIELESEFVYCCDGETYFASEFDIKVMKDGLLLRVPVESELK